MHRLPINYYKFLLILNERFDSTFSIIVDAFQLIIKSNFMYAKEENIVEESLLVVVNHFRPYNLNIFCLHLHQSSKSLRKSYIQQEQHTRKSRSHKTTLISLKYVAPSRHLMLRLLVCVCVCSKIYFFQTQNILSML